MEKTLSRAYVFEWTKWYSEGKEDAKDDKWLDYPVMMETDENVEKVMILVRIDHQKQSYKKV
jgi:hypothetical protein